MMRFFKPTLWGLRPDAAAANGRAADDLLQ
jgi:hypothetical protein